MCDQICKLAKKGLTPSQIGVILRDSHGIAQVRSVTGTKVLRILKGNGTLRTCLRVALLELRGGATLPPAPPRAPQQAAARPALARGYSGTGSGRGSGGAPLQWTQRIFRRRKLTRCVAPGLAPDIPEDLYHLIKKAVSVRKHLERNRKDRDSKFRLILIESRIHRLARYYRLAKKLPPNWRYESATASAMVA